MGSIHIFMCHQRIYNISGFIPFTSIVLLSSCRVFQNFICPNKLLENFLCFCLGLRATMLIRVISEYFSIKCLFYFMLSNHFCWIEAKNLVKPKIVQISLGTHSLCVNRSARSNNSSISTQYHTIRYYHNPTFFLDPNVLLFSFLAHYQHAFSFVTPLSLYQVFALFQAWICAHSINFQPRAFVS